MSRVAAFLLLAAASACLASGSPGTVLPFWPQYPNRAVTLLDGAWQFGYVGTSIADVINVKFADVTTPNATSVPSVFDNAPPGTLGPRGTAFYRKNVTMTLNTPGLLYLGACSFYCQVCEWVGGCVWALVCRVGGLNSVGRRRGSYVAWHACVRLSRGCAFLHRCLWMGKASGTTARVSAPACLCSLFNPGFWGWRLLPLPAPL